MSSTPSPYDPSPSPYAAGDDSSRFAAGGVGGGAGGDGMRRSPSGLHQHGLSSGANVIESATGKKTRFTSDSNIPSVVALGGYRSHASSGGGASSTAAAGGAATSSAPLSYVMPSPTEEHQQAAAAALSPAIHHHDVHGNGYVHGHAASYQQQHASGASYPSTSQPPLSHSPSPNYPHAHAHAHLSPLNLTAANAVGPHHHHHNYLPHAVPQSAPYMSAPSPMFSPFSPNFSSHPFSPNLLSPGAGPGRTPTSAGGAAAAGRTVYVGNLPADASVDELLNHVKFGPIENVKVLPEKSCAFISFLDANTAAAFHADASVKKLTLHGKELKIGWGRPSPVPPGVVMAVQQNQATRNVYVQLGQDDSTTEEQLRDDLSHFGPIDQIKIVRDKNIGFVHFLSIQIAIQVVSQLPQEPEWANRRVNFGKDRCAYVPKSQQQNQAHNSHAAAMGMAAAASLGYPTAFGFAGAGAGVPASAPARVGGFADAQAGTSSMDDSLTSPTYLDRSLDQIGNRTVYLGNIHPSATIEEICNHIRGGILQTVRYLPEKHIAFVTFVDANSALAFHHLSSEMGILLHHRRLKIGWGKHSGPLSPAIAMAVQAGCSRNVYIGNIEDANFLNEDKLRADFSRHGDVELVNSLREKNCAFVNFCSIQNAIKAIEAMKSHPDYSGVKISHGKDRCGRVIQVRDGGGGRGGGGGGDRGGGHAMHMGMGMVPSGAVAPAMEPLSPASHDANASATNGLGHSLSREPSAHDMPPIPVSTIAEEDGLGEGDASGEITAAGSNDEELAKATAASSLQDNPTTVTGKGASTLTSTRPVRRTVVVGNGNRQGQEGS